jgi:hypothetical protein
MPPHVQYIKAGSVAANGEKAFFTGTAYTEAGQVAQTLANINPLGTNFFYNNDALSACCLLI